MYVATFTHFVINCFLCLVLTNFVVGSFRFCSQSITDLSIQKIAETCLNLQKLCVSKCAELTDHTLTSLAQYNPYLNTLEVAGCHQFTDLGFQALGKVKIISLAQLKQFKR